MVVWGRCRGPGNDQSVVQQRMSWDRKHRGAKGGYYYRCRRVDGRPVKVYLGSGAAAEAAARRDEVAKREREAARVQDLGERARVAAADVALVEVRALAGTLAAAELVLAGYHNRRGEWRRRRDEQARTTGRSGNEGGR